MSQLPPPQPHPPLKPPSGTGAAAATNAASGRGIVVLIVCLVAGVVLFGLCMFGIVAAIFISAVGKAKEASGRAQSMNNVRQIGLALISHSSAKGYFSPQYTVDAAGRPLHSWRTSILPFLGYADLWDQIKHDEPWDSPANAAATNTELDLFRSPRYRDTGTTTNYVAIAGEGFLFNGNQHVEIQKVRDGLANTILIVEIANSDIAWAEPRDLTLEELQFQDAGVSPDTVNVVRSMAVVGFADGHVMTIQSGDSNELRKYLTIAGGEPATSW